MPRAARPRAADDEPAPVGPPALEEPEQVVVEVLWGLVGRGEFWRGFGEALVEEVQRRVVRVVLRILEKLRQPERVAADVEHARAEAVLQNVAVPDILCGGVGGRALDDHGHAGPLKVLDEGVDG